MTKNMKENFQIVFGMEIELTSAFDKEKIKSYYKVSTLESAQMGHEDFNSMENLLNCDVRKFSLYRNAISCFANGIDSSLMLELYHNSTQMFFEVAEIEENSWRFETSSALLGTRNFKMTTRSRTFNLELNKETLKEILRAGDDTIGLIEQNENNLYYKKVMTFNKTMKIKWKSDDVQLKIPKNNAKEESSKIKNEVSERGENCIADSVVDPFEYFLIGSVTTEMEK